MIDKIKLDDYAKALFEEIINRHPDWLDFAGNGTPDSDSGFTISIELADQGKSPIKISCYGDPDNLLIEWGDFFLDYFSIPELRNPSMFYPNVDEVVDIIDDKVIKFLTNI